MTEEQQPPVITLEEELKEYKDKYLRQLAELDNSRKRMQKEKQEIVRYSIDNVFAEMLAPVDNLENALKHTGSMSEETKLWAQGFQMILSQFKEVLTGNGVTEFSSAGTLFDPALHQAVEMEETTNVPEGTIIEEFVKGYKSGDRTIRPAQVKVAKAPGKAATQEDLKEKIGE